MRPTRLGAAWALALTACGTSSGSKLTNVPGEDSSAALIIGQGWNPVDNTAKGHCVKVGPLTTQSGSPNGQTAEFQLLEIKSETELREALGVSASASFGGIVGRGSVRESFTQSVAKNNQSRYLLIHVRVANQLDIASGFEFNDSALKLIKSGHSDRFTAQCGSEFVYGRRTGGEFFAVFEFAFLSTEEDRAFSAAVSASGAGWRGAAEVNAATAAFNKFSSTQVKMYKVGSSAPLPDISSVASFAANFNTLISNNQGGSVTLELITKSYDGVEPVDVRPNVEALVRQRYVMEKLGQNRDFAQEQLNTIQFIKTHPGRYHLAPANSLDKSEVELTSYINLVNDSAVSCFEDVVRGCKLPETPVPVVTLPERKPAAACRKEARFECKLPGDDGSCLAYEKIYVELCD